jgi:hypothetical protein
VLPFLSLAVLAALFVKINSLLAARFAGAENIHCKCFSPVAWEPKPFPLPWSPTECRGAAH